MPAQISTFLAVTTFRKVLIAARERPWLIPVDEFHLDSCYHNDVARRQYGGVQDRLAVNARFFVGPADVIGMILAARDLRGGLGREPALELYRRHGRFSHHGELVV